MIGSVINNRKFDIFLRLAKNDMKRLILLSGLYKYDAGSSSWLAKFKD